MTETHWTEDSIEDFVHRLSFDFITQLAKQLESAPLTRAELARRLNVSKGRISQILNNPSNLTLKKAVSYARALGMKVSMIAYNDHDPDNNNGPINPEVFVLCWERADRPADMWAVETIRPTSAATTAIDLDTLITEFDQGGEDLGYSFENYTAHIRRKPNVLSGSVDTQLSNMEIISLENTPRNLTRNVEVAHG